MSDRIYKAYQYAKERYAELGVDVDKAIERFNTIPISVNAWELDDLKGFMNLDKIGSDGGCIATGEYPGTATTFEQLTQDLDMILANLPGKKKVSCTAKAVCYTEPGLDLNSIEPKHFQGYVDWAKTRNVGLDFGGGAFGHPMIKNNFTLSSPDPEVRDFWIESFVRCAKIGEHMGKELNQKCITNIWIPDGYKDYPADQYSPRVRLVEALDTIYERLGEQKHNLCSLEGKVFGIGLEAYTVGSHDFYLAYAMNRKKCVTVDSGHYNPLEDVATKLSALMLFMDDIFMHVTRAMRWDSDHVVVMDDMTQAITNEIIRNNWEKRIHLCTDFFDASINRIAASVIGVRSLQKCILRSILENTEELRKAEREENYGRRLALMEEYKTMPFNAVYDYICESAGVPVGHRWLDEVNRYEKDVLSRR